MYAIHNFSDKDQSNNSVLSSISNAKVYVYIGNTLVRTYKPQRNRKGTVWIPFLIDETGNLVDVDDYKYANSWEAVRAILREYRPTDTVYEVDQLSIQESKELNKKGELTYHSGDLEGSVNLYIAAIDANPRNGQAYSNLGLSFQKLGREAEALWANRKAIELANGIKAHIIKASSYYNIARIYEAKSKWNEALNYYKLAKSYNDNPAYDKGIARVSAKN
ncbi:tetratricopeptide repeat protein [Flavobacterium oreochromis]|uniref:tetratricopeptide repeat protein n=1 Tax=Flavobacterium oreochromis TaxID=2906078 RepID=UPI002164A6E7|nr:tetratricopeptide repeat protein [Flavobacterium oreochromis]